MKLVLKSFIILFILAHHLTAQTTRADTVKLSYSDAQELFVKHNFELLSQKYNIDMAVAAKKQAGLWDNPVIFAEVNLYNPHNKTFFDVGAYNDPVTGAKNYGTYDVQINQLITLAGKKNKLVALSETNVQIQQQGFEELMRQIRLDLFNAYTDLYFNQQTLYLLQGEQKRIEALITSEKFALTKGVTSGYEITRLQFELQDLHSQINMYLNAIADDETSLNTILCNRSFVYYLPAQLPSLPERSVTITQLNDSALRNRPEVKIAGYTVNQNEINLKLQKASNVPDVILGAHYDRNGGAYFNYSGINISMPIPLFNLNQGNIRSARLQTKQAESNKEYTALSVEQDVYNSYQKYMNMLYYQKQIQPDYESSLENISIQAVESYNKRIIGLLDYIDKTRTYRDAQINLMQLKNGLLQSKQYVNYSCNSKIF